MEIERFGVVLKLEFEQLVDAHQTVVHQPGVSFWGRSTFSLHTAAEPAVRSAVKILVS